MLQAILDMVYPVRCPICGEIVLPKSRMICKVCQDKLIYIEEPRCKKCSKPVEHEEQEYCRDCLRKNYHYDKGFAVWVYDNAMRHSIANFKYHGRKEYAKFYTREVIRLYKEQILKLSPDVIIPVPLHRSKYRERGYNQAQLLASGIGKELKIPVITQVLIRDKKTLPQKKLSDKERLRNLSEAFQWNEKAACRYQEKITKVLLIDDIYTTGSTIEACSRVLQSAGVSQVYFIVLCIGISD